ncbi:MAG TPA: hypothetical protein VND99_00315 [Candidatus Acidoferrales bacterium]|nr:hypothetical protein [Candidatus Acidoferrales bacterium]
MPNFNPFNNDDEGASFEQGMPVSQAAKNVAKAATAQASQQVKDDTKAIVDQLYGLTPSGQDQDTDNDDPQAAAGQHTSNTGGAQSKTASGNTNQSPEEQAKMEKIRSELFANYSMKFKSAQNAAGINSATIGLDQEMEKARQMRKQKEEQRKQEEEEEERRKKEEEEKKKEEVALPAGKKTGSMFGKKQQQPMAVQLARTKTEVNRGTSG